MAQSVQSVPQTFRKMINSYDPVLTSLFDSSLGPVDIASRKSAQNPTEATSSIKGDRSDLIEKPVPQTETIPTEKLEHEEQVSEDDLPLHRTPMDEILHQRSRKRKRKHADDNLEGTYMQNSAREEIREDQKRRRQGRSPALNLTSSKEGKVIAEELIESEGGSPEEGDDGESSPSDAPQHESLSASKADSEVEKASRTVFLGNVSTAAIKSKTGKKSLLEHLASFLTSLPTQQTAHKVESIRFRSTAFNSNDVPKKASFAKKELMDSTTKSTNAYAVYTTQLAAREATKRLNGTIILDRHLRVDSVAHPARQDHRRCVFVGNLAFVDDESSLNPVEDDVVKRPRKAKVAADAEEGLWRQFSKAGTVESVRVVRDKTTRVGKGFAYVQFEDPNGVEKALLYNDKKFAPLLPRVLRVTRAKNASKTNTRQQDERRPKYDPVHSQTSSGYQPKITPQTQSLTGRAGKLLGRAGAAQFRDKQKRGHKSLGVKRSPEAIVFEGHRASSKQGKGMLKQKGSKKQTKPQGRSSRRGAAFKAGGRKKRKADRK
ncbi:MAG: hypothetical protein Q9195_001978 [Heterodermia aff. obscurata]